MSEQKMEPLTLTEKEEYQLWGFLGNILPTLNKKKMRPKIGAVYGLLDKLWVRRKEKVDKNESKITR